MDDNIKLYSLLDGEIRSSAIDLPPPDTKRWVTRRKAVIVNAVRTGVISLEEVCRRYELSVEEFHAWQRASTVMMFCSSSAVIPKAPAIKRSALASSRSRAIRL